MVERPSSRVEVALLRSFFGIVGVLEVKYRLKYFFSTTKTLSSRVVKYYSGGDHNTDMLGIYNTDILTAIIPLTSKIWMPGLTAITPLTSNFQKKGMNTPF